MNNQNVSQIVSIPKKNVRFNSFFGGIIFVIILLGVGYLIWSLTKSGGIEVGILGPNEVKAGETKEFKIVYANKSRVALEDVELVLALPEGVIFSDDPTKRVWEQPLETIASGQEAEQAFNLMFFGENRSAKNLEATFRYRPKTLTSPFTKTLNYPVIINGSTFKLDATLPPQVLPEQDFSLNVAWENQSSNSYEDVRLEATWPETYAFNSATPKPSEKDNIWSLGQTPAASQGQLDIKGLVSGSEGANRKFVFKILVYIQEQPFVISQMESYLTVVNNPLIMSASVNDERLYNADADETLTFKINYRNDYSIGLRNVSIKAILDGKMFDLASVRPGKGYYTVKSKTITWTSANLGELSVLNPGEVGEVSFTVKTLKKYPIKVAGDRNFLMTMNATMLTATIPEMIGVNAPIKAASSVSVKMNTMMELETLTYFRDAASQIINSGRLPLRVAQPTQLTIHWKLKNYSNPVQDVVVKTTLPPGVSFTGRVGGNSGENQPTYDAATAEVSWKLPNIAATSGVIGKPLEAIFQIEVTPASNQVNQAINLTNEITLTALDTFTQKQISVIHDPIKSDKFTDVSVLPQDGIVAP